MIFEFFHARATMASREVGALVAGAFYKKEERCKLKERHGYTEKR
jgi:hypothetical protein